MTRLGGEKRKGAPFRRGKAPFFSSRSRDKRAHCQHFHLCLFRASVAYNSNKIYIRFILVTMGLIMAAKKRSISFTEELDSKLVELCEALSISPNSYINNVVAKAVLNDRTAMVSQKASSEGMEKMLQMFSSVIDEDKPESEQ